jgi:L-ribulose-5-phosphate 3-epimerase
MNPTTTRRQFLAAASTVGAAALAAPAGHANRATRLVGGEEDGSSELFDISLAQWSNHRSLHGGQITNLDWISSAREKYGVHAIEFVNGFFKDKACDWEYLRQMKLRALDAGVRMLLIMIDGEGALATENEKERAAAIARHHRWIVAASYLGCHSIRVNAAGSGDADEMQKRAADSLVQLADFGLQYGIDVIVENHGGLSSNGAWLAGVMKLADNPHVGTLPDFGNFRLGGGKEYDRYRGVTELMPYAKAVSAKSHEFDADGNEIHTDFVRMMKIVKDAGYRGFVGIEYEGSKHTEDDGIRLTRDLLIRVRKEMA